MVVRVWQRNHDLLIIQVVSGMALGTIYSSSAGDAYESVKYISSVAPFGSLLRGIHYFGASAMIVFTGMHMLRIYLMGSFKYPRELSWLTGVGLLFLTVGMGFTGQILRWDQNSVWTVAVGANQAMRAPFIGKYLVEILNAGPEVGAQTLSHIFSYHVFLLPGILIGAIVIHIWMVLFNGISEPPKVGELVDPATYKKKYHDLLERDGQPFWPVSVSRDIIFSTIVVLGILALAHFVGPPAVDIPPDPSIIQAQPKPDWYLLWYFSLLAIMPKQLEDVSILLCPVIAVLVLLAPAILAPRGERSPSRRPWAVATVFMVVSFIGILTYLGVKEPWSPNFDAKAVPIEVIGAKSGPVYDGAQVFNTKGCLFCHTISHYGGTKGPDLTHVGSRLTHDQVTIRVINGGNNMPAYAGNITPEQLKSVTTFLESRK